MKKLILVTLILLFSVSVQAKQPIKFLEGKSAFCYSEQALARYLKFIKARDLDGMNKLVIKGKCAFVPDGEVVKLENYRIGKIGKTKIVEFELENQSVWTFNALVQSVDFSNL